ncbi:MAG: hypothetical protein P1U42_06660 [Phycisphaerales bacterium]|nr:hypothetical protein [Phycisphaerales bacterium]
MQVRACSTRLNGSKLGLSLVAGFAALPAIAGTPAVLDRVPTDAQGVVVVSNFGGLLNDINTINGLMGEQGEPMIMMVTSMVRGMPGLNLEGSMAGVLSFEEGEEEPEVVLLVPVADFEAFSEGHAFNDGLYEFNTGDSVMYFRDASRGFAVMGESGDLVAEYDSTPGQLKTHTQLLGKSGGRVADSNDAFVYFNFDAFSDQIEAGLEEMEAEGEMVEMMGGAEAAAGFDAMMDVARSIANDGASFVMGINFDEELGFAFDLGMQFKEGSSSASYLQNDGDSSKYLNNIPAMDYFMASSYDISGDGIRKLATDYMDFIEQFDTTGMVKDMDLGNMLNGFNGGIQVMGASDNVMGGLFNKTMYYIDVDEPDRYINFIQGMYEGMNESMAELEEVGVTVDAKMDAEPTEINGVEAYGYSFAMDMSQMEGMDAMGGPNPMMIMSMIFGGEGGPSGYMAKTGKGIVSTLSKDADFFTMAVNGANGKNSMSGNKSIATTAAMLPNNRIMETYIGANHLANTAGPMMMMFGLIPEFEPIGSLPPIGMGLTADGGGILFRTAIPLETIGTIMEMIPEDAFESDDEEMDF